MTVATQYKNQCYVNGKWVSSESGKTFAVTNPATGEHIADVPDMTEEEVLGAVKAAEDAFPAWSTTPPKVSSAQRSLRPQHANDRPVPTSS